MGHLLLYFFSFTLSTQPLFASDAFDHHAFDHQAFEAQLECVLQDSLSGFNEKFSADLQKNLDHGGRGLLLEFQVHYNPLKDSPQLTQTRQVHQLEKRLRRAGAYFYFKKKKASRTYTALLFTEEQLRILDGFRSLIKFSETKVLSSIYNQFAGQKLSFPVQYQDLQIQKQIQLKDLLSLLNLNSEQTLTAQLRFRYKPTSQQNILALKHQTRQDFPDIIFNLRPPNKSWTTMSFQFSEKQKKRVIDLLRTFPEWGLTLEKEFN